MNAMTKECKKVKQLNFAQETTELSPRKKMSEASVATQVGLSMHRFLKKSRGQKWKAVLSFDSTLDLLEVPNQEETSGTHMDCSEGPEMMPKTKIHKVTNKSKIQRLMTPSATTEARLRPFGTVWNFSQVACDPSWVYQRRDALDGEMRIKRCDISRSNILMKEAPERQPCSPESGGWIRS